MFRTFRVSASAAEFSAAGGTEPRSGRDGNEIFYGACGGRLISGAIEDPVHRVFASPRALFRLPGQVPAGAGFSYDVTRAVEIPGCVIKPLRSTRVI
jgi:hypothetical protein